MEDVKYFSWYLACSYVTKICYFFLPLRYLSHQHFWYLPEILLCLKALNSLLFRIYLLLKSSNIIYENIMFKEVNFPTPNQGFSKYYLCSRNCYSKNLNINRTFTLYLYNVIYHSNRFAYVELSLHPRD